MITLPSYLDGIYHLELDTVSTPEPDPATVPEPSTLLLLCAGLGGVTLWRRKTAKG